MTFGLLLTALLLGARHGIDWDHIAAIADLSGTARNRRHGFALSLLYAIGHGAVVFALGTAAIVAGLAIPDGLDRAMGAVVGLTLIWLGAWVVIDLVRRGRHFRLRSRWMLVLDGTFAGLRAVRSRRGRRIIAIDHEHPHPHVDDAHDDPAAHDHAHLAMADDRGPVGPVLRPEIDDPGPVAPAVGSASGAVGGRVRSMLAAPRLAWRDARRAGGYEHSHRHHHELTLPEEVGPRSQPSPSATVAAGVGVLHGVGVESPTQIAIFVASTSVVGATAGVALLAAWVAGLIIANSGLALLAGVGVLSAERNFALYVAVAVVVAAGSVIMGVLLLTGLDVLPEITP